MKKIFQYYILFTSLFLLPSCEGIVGGDGYLYDSKTKYPIKGVRVILFLNDKAHDTCYSDEKGFFRGSKFVGCVPNCPCAKLVMTKDSFKTMTINFKEYWTKNNYGPKLQDSLTIFLERDKY